MEVAGFHATETRDPARDFPRGIFAAAAVILGVSVLVTLSIAFVVPPSKLSLVAGLMQAFSAFFAALGFGSSVVKVLALLVFIGTLAQISSWLVGPSKGLYATEATGDLEPRLDRMNKSHVPVAILIAQGVVASLFTLLFLLLPSINTSYWILSALTTQVVVMMYILVFAAAIRLRYTQPGAARPYKIPGGKVGMWIAAGMGVVSCAYGLVVGFIPPTSVRHWPTPLYAGVLALALVLFSLPSFIIEKIKKPGWILAHPDPVLVDSPDSKR
jgi:amino acid transporter